MDEWINEWKGFDSHLSLSTSFPFPSVLEASHGSSKLQLRPLVQEGEEYFPDSLALSHTRSIDELGVAVAA